jgi:chemotaxis protein histidine kinase CheA
MGTAGGSQIDPALLELFQAEMDAHIPVLNQGLLALEKRQAGDLEIEGMMRAAHSIKGAAKIVGIEAAVRVSHIMEDCFTAAKDKTVVLSSDSVDVLLQGVDALQRICSPLEASAINEAFLQDLLARMSLVKTAPTTAKPATVIAGSPARSGSADLVAATARRDEPSVTLPAVFDHAALAALRRELLDTLLMHPSRMRLDFAHVGQLPVGGLALLVAFVREVGRTESAPRVEATAVSSAVRSILRVAGVSHAFGLGG